MDSLIERVQATPASSIRCSAPEYLSQVTRAVNNLESGGGGVGRQQPRQEEGSDETQERLPPPAEKTKGGCRQCAHARGGQEKLCRRTCRSIGLRPRGERGLRGLGCGEHGTLVENLERGRRCADCLCSCSDLMGGCSSASVFTGAVDRSLDCFEAAAAACSQWFARRARGTWRCTTAYRSSQSLPPSAALAAGHRSLFFIPRVVHPTTQSLHSSISAPFSESRRVTRK